MGPGQRPFSHNPAAVPQLWGSLHCSTTRSTLDVQCMCYSSMEPREGGADMALPGTISELDLGRAACACALRMGTSTGRGQLAVPRAPAVGSSQWPGARLPWLRGCMGSIPRACNCALRYGYHRKALVIIDERLAIIGL